MQKKPVRFLTKGCEAIIEHYGKLQFEGITIQDGLPLAKFTKTYTHIFSLETLKKQGYQVVEGEGE